MNTSRLPVPAGQGRLQTWRAAFPGDVRPQIAAYVGACLLGLALGLSMMISPLVGVGLVVILAFVALALTRPVMLCYVVIIAVIFTGGLERGRFVPLLVPSEAVLLAAVALSVPIVLLKKRATRIPSQVVFATLILVVGVIILPVGGYYLRQVTIQPRDLFSMMAPIKFILAYWLFATLPDNDLDRQRLIQCMLVCASAVAFVGLLQGLHIGGVSDFLTRWYPSDQTNDASNIGRVTSLLRAWNALGMFLMLCILLMIAIYTSTENRRFRANIMLTLFLCATCLLASGSFAGILGVVLGVAIVKYFDRRGLKVLVMLGASAALAALIVWPLISQRLNYQYGGYSSDVVPQTLTYRFLVWREVVLPAIREHWLLGTSPTLTGLNFPFAESEYIFLVFRSGAVSLVAHLIWVGIILRWLLQRIRSTVDPIRPYAITAYAVIVVLSINGLTNEVFTYTGSMEYLWIILALAAAASTGGGTPDDRNDETERSNRSNRSNKNEKFDRFDKIDKTTA